ncbi:DNA internalization-related competence protein ComEC/Rec2 [Atopobacter phocae]|uniref:DNA internalization-related competence protein ComEC/Rec2 n=1 Tax=Atopobacter phocae TaxID=136492 RepID=UPI000471A749|nr:DNA internalization-related competence protein ComEC/Rec2 [Atopobacter phocae]
MIKKSKAMKGQFFIIWIAQIIFILGCIQPNRWIIWGCLLLLCLRIYSSRIKYLMFYVIISFGLTASTYYFNQYLLAQKTNDQSIQHYIVTIEPYQLKKKDWGYTGIGYTKQASPQKVLVHLPMDEALEYVLLENEQIEINGEANIETFLGPDNFGAFHAKNYYLSQQITKKVSFKKIERLKKGKSIFYNRWRNQWYGYLNQMPYIHARNYLQAFLFNETNNLDTNIKNSFKKLGLMPFLALSGFHIQLIVKYLKGLLYRTSMTIETNRKIISVVLISYGLITDWPISLIRAIALFFCSEWGSKNYTKLDYLSLIGIILLIVRPFYIYSISYQLSFGMTLVILLVNESLKKLQLINQVKWQHRIAAHICYLMAAFIGTSYYFFEINLGLILWNALMGIFLEWLLLPVLLTFLAYPYLTVFDKWYEMVDSFLNHFNQYFIYFSNHNKLSVIVGQLSPFMVIISILLLIYLIQKINSPFVWNKKFIGILGILFLLILSPKFSSKQSVIFINVGQGDAMLVYTPFKKFTALIDTGGRITYEKGKIKKDIEHVERVVLPALKREGVSQLDYLMLSHPDFDHMGNALELLKKIPVKHVLVSEQSINHSSYQVINDWRQKNHQLPIEGIKPNYQINKNSLNLRLLGPLAPYATDDKNDDSLVWWMSTKSNEFMLTGDASVHVEEAIIKAYETVDEFKSINVLKVGHHGSLTSTSEEFLDFLQPKQAIISAGRNNRYKHPHQEVVDRLNDKDIQIYDTRIHGAIRYDESFLLYFKPKWQTSR